MNRSCQFVILCVDDEPLLLKVRELVLRGQDYQVKTAGTASEALEIFESSDIDLVITNHFLPDGTGVDLARQMKNLKQHVPIMLLTGAPEPPDGTETVDDYLMKGTLVPIFLEHVKALLWGGRMAERQCG